MIFICYQLFIKRRKTHLKRGKNLS